MSVREVLTLWDRGCKAYQKGDFADAIEAFQEIDDDDQTARLYTNQGLCYMRVDAIEFAQQLFEAACDLDEHFALSPFLLAYALFKQSKYKEVKPSCRLLDRAKSG
eukprot:TRINITY_DN12574_c2_g1_i4.p2 TRINITY_DN12574_c2_g1~~TRINITY_DN12574_c2_g1_i4.p2  ORF type:complete len:122 (+),score=14.32 TRINITY_DN12574_c2_g1_i4:50-367(+)